MFSVPHNFFIGGEAVVKSWQGSVELLEQGTWRKGLVHIRYTRGVFLPCVPPSHTRNIFGQYSLPCVSWSCGLGEPSCILGLNFLLFPLLPGVQEGGKRMKTAWGWPQTYYPDTVWNWKIPQKLTFWTISSSVHMILFLMVSSYWMRFSIILNGV